MHLNILFSNTPKTNHAIYQIVTPKNDLNKYGLPLLLQKETEKFLKENKQEILTTYNDKQKYTVFTYCNTETEYSVSLNNARILGSKIYKALQKDKINNCFLKGLTELNKQEAYALIEGILITSYQFNKYKKNSDNSINTLYIEKNSISLKELDELQKLICAQNIARDLVNEPVISLNALALSSEIQKLGKNYGFTVKVMHKTEIQKLKMGGLLGVNRGSDDPPTFNILEYKPKIAKNKKPLILVGKGVVYDTGGYNLKISGFMSTMKCDMAGAAAVAGTICAIASNKLNVHVIGLIPATDNRIGHNALVQDDIITMHDGTTVEIQNTDAEGRLILADALSYAKKYKPMLVIDLATLTGAAAAVTGHYGIGLMGTADKKVITDLMESGEEVYERCIEFPFWKEFEELLKSDVADLKNIGGAVGGASTAGKFLQHFTDYPWIHLDIAGPAFIKEGAKGYQQKGATGVGVRLLYNFAKKMK